MLTPFRSADCEAGDRRTIRWGHGWAHHMSIEPMWAQPCTGPWGPAWMGRSWPYLEGLIQGTEAKESMWSTRTARTPWQTHAKLTLPVLGEFFHHSFPIRKLGVTFKTLCDNKCKWNPGHCRCVMFTELGETAIHISGHQRHLLEGRCWVSWSGTFGESSRNCTGLEINNINPTGRNIFINICRICDCVHKKSWINTTNSEDLKGNSSHRSKGYLSY